MKRCPECKRAYNDDSFDYCLDDGATLVYGPGNSDPTATAILDMPPSEAPTTLKTVDPSEAGDARSRRKLIFLASVVIVALAATFIAYRSISGNSTIGSILSNAFTAGSQPQIRSLAVLPLKPLDASDNYIGMGIADAIIRRMSQTGQLIVRPTS